MAHPGTGIDRPPRDVPVRAGAASKVDHIPYRGAAPALQDIAGGHVDLFFATPQSGGAAVARAGEGLRHHLEGDLAAVSRRPSFVQRYGPKLEILFWHIMLAPAGTPSR